MGAPVESSPAISLGGSLAVGANDGALHAYNRTTGASLWTASTDGAAPSSPAWAGNTVYVGAANGSLYAFRESDGARLWRATTGGATSSPVVSGSTVYVGSNDGRLYALDASTGALRWSQATGGGIWSSPSVGTYVYVGSNDGKVYAFDASNGTLHWTAITGGPVVSTPATALGDVYVGSNDGKVYALDASSGALRWSTATAGAVDSSPAVDDGTVYVAGEDGELRALDPGNGTTRWTSPLGSGALSSPAVADGVVYVGTRAGLVAGFNAVSGSMVWSDTTGGAVLSSPAVQDSTVYVGSDDGTLYAYVGPDPCNPVVSRIACENSRPGAPASQWDVQGSGDPSIQGFATDISVNVGGTVHFKISTPASSYHADIYRIGYYGGSGARLMASIRPSAPLPQSQPACLTDSTTNLVDCGNWAESASWTVPSNAVSGVYFAKLVRDDTRGASQIIFVVRDDSSHADILFQTSDTTWEAYNTYGGEGIYINGPNGLRAYKASYNRPLNNRGSGFEPNQFFGSSEYPTVRFLEANGYDVTYASSIDTDRYGANLRNHKVFMSVGHDEYWSAAQRANVTAARDAGVNLAFLSGNEIYWKTRWEPSTDPSATPYRTLVVYKETLANAKIDPSPTWTGLWRDYRFSPPSDGAQPENALSGTSYGGNPENCCGSYSLTVSSEEGHLRLWRDTNLATLPPNTTSTFGDRIVGYEFDEDFDNGVRPAGLFELSSTTVSQGAAPARASVSPSSPAISPGSDAVVGASQPTPTGVAQPRTSGAAPVAAAARTGVVHHLTFYRAASRALVFSAGTLQWGWGLDGHADGGTTPDPRVRQATVNLLADMGVQPYTLQGGLVPATASSDTVAPTSTITSPSPGTNVVAGSGVAVTGTATDSGGGRVGGVEVSTDGGQTWHPASGRSSWAYMFSPNLASGPLTIKSRATDDSGNIETPTASVTIVVIPRPCPCTLFGSSTPTNPDSGSGSAIEVGVKVQPDTSGRITGVRFYKSSANAGPHSVSLWTSTGTLLATAPATAESASGWQDVSFASPVAVTAGSVYVASYHTNTGHVADDDWYSTYPAEFFHPTGLDRTPLHMVDPRGPYGPSVYANSATSTFPTQRSLDSNYWVDVDFSP